MPDYTDIPVTLPRDNWERILAALDSAPNPTPLATRLRDAVDSALNERIEESVNRFMSVSESE